jgi:hypothetical protein
MKNKVFWICIIVVISLRTSFAGTWDFIIQNDNVTAEKKMIKELASDSTKLETIVGLIYSAELRKDNLSHTKYCKLLVNQHPIAYNFFLY